MDEIARGGNAWTFHRPLANLRCGAISGRVDVSQPGLGLHDIALGGRPVAARLLSIRGGDGSTGQSTGEADAWPVVDAYLRGSDLVATYGPQADWPFSPQVYWQAGMPALGIKVPGGLSLFVSLQTHLLDTWPRIDIASQTRADEILRVTPGSTVQGYTESLTGGSHNIGPSTSACCVLRRLAGGDYSYAEMMPASDFREIAVQHGSDGGCSTRWTLFADFLEKGVIWRARLQSVLLPRENDVELALACCRAMEQRPLPLTT